MNNKQSFLRYQNIFNNVLHHYYQIVRLHTGYRIQSKIFLLFIILIGVSSIFLRIEIFEKIQSPLLLNILLFFTMCNIIFLQFNFACRLTITLGKGIPFFFREICNKQIPYINYYFIGFICYNLTLLMLSSIVLLRIYTVMYIYNPILFNIILSYTTFISLILYIIYIDFNFKDYNFDLGKEYSLSFIQTLLILTFPFIVCLNISNFIIPYLRTISFLDTIHCQPTDG